MKRILYLRTDIFNQELVAGGSVSHTVGVINGFIDLGYSIVCASSVSMPLLKTLALEELVIVSNPRFLSFLRWKLNCLLSNIFFTLQILVVTKKYRFDSIYQRYSILNFSGVLIRAIKKIPLILEYNGSEVWINNNWAINNWFKLTWLVRKIELTNLRYADQIVVVSKALKDDLVHQGINESKILINPNGVDTQFYNPDMLQHERAAVRSNLGIDDKFIFGFVGSFSAWHGIELLARVIPRIIQEKPQAHFLMIGDGPLKSFLEQELDSAGISNENVTFTGIQDAYNARKFLAACDAYLCPTQPNPDGSEFFGSPTKLFEYMSMGKPIIASDIGQIKELIYPALHAQEVVDNHVGFLLDPANKEQYVATLCYVMDMKLSYRQKMGSCARARAVEHYQWKAHVEKIVKEVGI